MGLADSEVPIAATGPSDIGREACFVPDGTPSEDDAAIANETGAQLILDLAQKYDGDLEIFAVAPMTPLARALSGEGGQELLSRAVKRLHIQGQGVMENRQLVPDFQAFNLREDKESSRFVFEQLRNHVPFHFLGKHAAYRVSLMREDFASWDAILGGDEMMQAAKNNMNVFREGNPELFYRLYPMPEEKRTDELWFGCMTVMSHPYDPLALLAAFKPELFTHQIWQSSQDQPAHQLCGNDAENHGIEDEKAARHVLANTIRRGAERLAATRARM